MIVCSCRGVPCRRIREEVRKGARTLGAVRQACRAGGVCGACRPQIAELIAEESHESDGGQSVVVTIGGGTAAA